MKEEEQAFIKMDPDFMKLDEANTSILPVYPPLWWWRVWWWFWRMDTDHDGKMTWTEFYRGMLKYHPWY